MTGTVAAFRGLAFMPSAFDLPLSMSKENAGRRRGAVSINSLSCSFNHLGRSQTERPLNGPVQMPRILDKVWETA
ncbi:hypothetical protein [Xanthobacter sp. 91]|uniref:hypothetical protein n=1 Tax=Xanthobacter sp. 91 TaxID=1117244 RepID=UPI0012DE97F8|nr:hypothetical protein [Xanthobacter sp. 91]